MPAHATTVLALLLVAACSPPPVNDLSIVASPSSLRTDGSLVTVTVVATTDGKVGAGSLRLSTTAGVLDSTELELDAFGKARTHYQCDRALDERCSSGTVTLTAEWLAAPPVNATTKVALSDASTVMKQPCDFGTARSTATTSTLDLYGKVVFFNGGASLAAGRYAIRYLDGCMKFAPDQGWTIHAYEDGRSAWWLVGATSSLPLLMPPGTVGWSPSNGAFSTFADCVAANRALSPKEFDFAGGVLGIWLRDTPYSDRSQPELAAHDTGLRAMTASRERQRWGNQSSRARRQDEPARPTGLQLDGLSLMGPSLGLVGRLSWRR